MSKTPAVYLYNPDDEVDADGQFGGCRFPLAPNSATHIVQPGHWSTPTHGPFDPHATAAHIVSQLGQWGVCQVSGPVVNGKTKDRLDQQRVNVAEKVYLERTSNWAREMILEYNARNAPFVASKLPDTQPTPDEEKAFGWWKKNQKRISAATKKGVDV